MAGGLYGTFELVGFFSNSKPPKVTDVSGYNHAVAKIWFVFVAVLELTGVPICFLNRIHSFTFFLVFPIFALVIGSMKAYMRIE